MPFFHYRKLLHAQFEHPLIRQALAEVAQAHVVLIATPIYKAAYSGVLKAFLDLLPQDALRGKTVLPLATGGSIAHLLALDYALKPVLSALGRQEPTMGFKDQPVRPVLSKPGEEALPPMQRVAPASEWCGAA